MKTITKSVDYKLKWRFKDHRHIKVSECKKIINVKTGRFKKITLNGYSVGIWIGRKFIIKSEINNHLERITDDYCPF